jgi:hypothetical protein
MASCEFMQTCIFLNNKVVRMPITTQKLVESYCDGDFTKCTIHKNALAHGIDKVPKYVSPDDEYELSDWMIELVLVGRLGW